MSERWVEFREFVERTEDFPAGEVMRGSLYNDPGDEVIAAYDAPYLGPESKVSLRALPLLVERSDRTPEGAATVIEALRTDPPHHPAPGRTRGTSAIARPKSGAGRSEASPPLPSPRREVLRSAALQPLADRRHEALGVIDCLIHLTGWRLDELVVGFVPVLKERAQDPGHVRVDAPFLDHEP